MGFAEEVGGQVSDEVNLEGPKFEVKDSGQRQQFESGMQRDVTDDKVRFDLVFDGPMLARYAAHLTKGAEKYEPRTWMKANSAEEMDRFRQSAIRHFMQWANGEVDEDHAAAVMFNINGYEYVKNHLGSKPYDDYRRRYFGFGEFARG